MSEGATLRSVASVSTMLCKVKAVNAISLPIHHPGCPVYEDDHFPDGSCSAVIQSAADFMMFATSRLAR